MPILILHESRIQRRGQKSRYFTTGEPKYSREDGLYRADLDIYSSIINISTGISGGGKGCADNK